MAMRDGLLSDLATDSVTSPEKTVFLGNTVPSTSVATESLAWTLVPIGVFPAVTSCFRFTGNSFTLVELADDGIADDEPGAAGS
jgi:hypothetical protein